MRIKRGVMWNVLSTLQDESQTTKKKIQALRQQYREHSGLVNKVFHHIEITEDGTDTYFIDNPDQLENKMNLNGHTIQNLDVKNYVGVIHMAKKLRYK